MPFFELLLYYFLGLQSLRIQQVGVSSLDMMVWALGPGSVFQRLKSRFNSRTPEGTLLEPLDRDLIEPLSETLKKLCPRVQVPNDHILSKILTCETTFLKPST